MNPIPLSRLTAVSAVCLHLTGVPGAADEIADVRSVYAEVNAADLEVESFEYNDPPTGSSGQVVQYAEPDSSRFRKLKTTVGVDDGGSTVTEYYLDREGGLRFVFVTREGHEYGDDGTPYIESSQQRLYFDAEQNLLRALAKEARADSIEKIAGALDASDNREVPIDPIPARRILESVDELCRSLNPERARDASQLSRAALELSDEPDPPADKSLWVSIPIESGKTYPSKKFHHEIFNEIVAEAELPHPEAEAPALHLYQTHRYPGDFSVTTLATADRLYHDSIDSIRYRMDIRESPDDRIHVSFFGFQIRPRLESPRRGVREGWVAEDFERTSPSPE